MPNKTPTEAEIVEAMARGIWDVIGPCRMGQSKEIAQAALAAQRAMGLVLTQGWQPIETVPEGVREILGYQATEGDWQGRIAGCSLWARGCWMGGGGLIATHWMPLPAPPIAAAQEKKID